MISIMTNVKKIAHIIGNGTSRIGINLIDLKNKGIVFGCNALYRDFIDSDFILPDYLVAIDKAITEEIKTSTFPLERFIDPPEDEKWEPVEVHWGNSMSEDWDAVRPRSNAGTNAILEAIKRDFTQLYIFGFDFLIINKNMALDNIYNNTSCYKDETKVTLRDTRNRMKYIGWIIENNPNINFTFCYPRDILNNGVYKPVADNCSFIDFNELYSRISKC